MNIPFKFPGLPTAICGSCGRSLQAGQEAAMQYFPDGEWRVVCHECVYEKPKSPGIRRSINQDLMRLLEFMA